MTRFRVALSNSVGGTNLSVFLLTIIGQTGFLALFRQPVTAKENCVFKPSVLHLKIDRVLHLAHGEGVGYTHII